MNQKAATFSSRAREFMRQSGMSEKQFAAKANYKSVDSVHVVLNKYDRVWPTPTDRVIVRWAEALGVTPGELMGDE